jgi:predicted MPP superfamily phosphohydrolase
MERFSRKNIDEKLKYIRLDSPLEPIKDALGYLIDISPYIAFILGLVLFALTNNPFFIFWLLFFGILSIFFFYINVINYNNFKINKYDIPIHGLTKTFQFILVTDIHVGSERTATKLEKFRKLIHFVNSSGLDTIILGGDFVYKEIDEKLLSELSKIRIKNKIAVYGNHDSLYLYTRQTEEVPTKFLEIFKKTGFKMLLNEAVEINEIYFGGVPDLYSKNFDLDKTFRGINDGVKILISHNPDIVDFIEPSDNISLVMSGHNHAGQINLPILGPLLPMPGKHRWMQKGLYTLSNTKLFMSQGFGSGGARTRIGTDPEVCIIKLVPSEV